MEALLSKWNEFSERDRLVLGVGGILVVLIMGYTFVWEPWQASLERLAAQVPAKRLAWQRIDSMAAIAGNYTAGGGEASQADRKPLLTVVEDTARRARLRDVIRQMTPGEEEGQVRIWLSDAPFDTWLTWVDTLGNEHGVDVITATVQRAEENKVDIRATLGY